MEDIARKLRAPEFRNILMNIPGRSPQSTILDLVNEAAAGMNNGQPEYARQLVREAVNVLDRTAGRGWYTPSDIQPIQAMILRNAKRGFREAGYTWMDKTQHVSRNKRNHKNQWREGGARLFNPDQPNFPRSRGDSYTDDHWQGSRNLRGQNPRFDRSRDRSQGNQSKTMRSQNRSYLNSAYQDSAYRDNSRNSVRGSSDRGGTQRYYSDDFYYYGYPWEDRGRNLQNDLQGDTRRSLRHRETGPDRMPWTMEQNRRQHARGKAGFYQERPEDSGRERQFDRGPGKDKYFESTTREHSRGYQG